MWCSQRPAASWVLFCMTRNGAVETAQGWEGLCLPRVSTLFLFVLLSDQARDNQREI